MNSQTVKVAGLYADYVGGEDEMTLAELISLSSKSKTEDAQFLAAIRQMVVDQVIGDSLEQTIKLATERGYEVEVIELS